jgi:chemotaxis protein MotA
MDRALVIGIILGIIMLVLGIWMQLTGPAASFGSFWSAGSLFIVGGGMVASIFVSFPLSNVIGLGEAIGAVIKEENDKMGPMVDEACHVADIARKGAAELDKSVGSIVNPFFKDGVQMVRDGYDVEELTEIMETRIKYREKREKLQADMLRSMGTLAPAWGMVGTLMGLVIMLAGFGGEGGADGLGPGMSAALITTFYGAIFANLFFNPMANKLEVKTRKTSIAFNMLVQAARLIHQKKHPIIMREKLNSFIPPREWKRGDVEINA